MTNLREFIEDMGPSDKVKGGPVNIIGGEGTVIVETYAVMKMADDFRGQLWPHQIYGIDPIDRQTLNGLTGRITCTMTTELSREQVEQMSPEQIQDVVQYVK